MKLKIRYLITALVLFLGLIVLIVPFTNFKLNSSNQVQYCRYRLAVYECERIESAGEGEEISDTYFDNLKLGKQVGGPLEYIGLRDIERTQDSK